MKNRIIASLFAASILVVASVRAAVLVADTFDSPAINSANWQIIKPYSYSEVISSGYSAITSGRGILASIEEFAAPFVLSGSFRMNHKWENFTIAFRTDLTPLTDPGLAYTLSGLFVTICNDADQVSIQGEGFSPMHSTDETHKMFALSTDVTYGFALSDDGYNVQFSIDGVPLLSAATDVATGAHVAFYSREFQSTSSTIDYVAIEEGPSVVAARTAAPVPDTGLTSTFLLLTVGVMLKWGPRRELRPR